MAAGRDDAGRLSGKRAIVTGGASGIGRATALRLASEGATVSILDRDELGSKQTAEAIVRSGGSAEVEVCDVSDAVSVDAAVGRVVDRMGGLTTVFACAGIRGSLDRTHELTDADWFDTLEVNLSGVFFTARAALRVMVSGNAPGSIITCGSTSSFVATQGKLVPYRASKGGVLMLTRAIAVEYAQEGIRANCVCPGPVATTLASEDEKFSKVANPMGRYGRPEEIASLVAFLGSSDSGGGEGVE